ncbi:uncharacterized protein LOC131023489 [Salvia miltiorrhiza]|uniref:uncharacterized protein LOC131023489 n=1 Tax=Salvia miltiorrhiza TaxID=226208 RepID=UPI0025ACC6EA|nr:uncharacterized protein LOC131023489 [Salvia miltiorrhiza]
MEVKVSPNCSFTWRSLCWGRELIARGTRWKVGDGRSIRVTKDRWIPGRDIWQEQRAQTEDNNRKVADFITAERQWHVGKLKEVFPDFLVPAICSIDLPVETKSDTFFWGFDEKGRYSVKSGVKGAWKSSIFWDDISPFIHLSLRDLSSVVADRKGDEGLELWFFQLWFVWKSFCDFKHNPSNEKTTVELQDCRLWLDEYKKVRLHTSIPERVLPLEGERRWYPPPPDILRLDVDVAFDNGGQRLGAGFLLRDSRGKIVAASCQRIGFTPTVLLGELHAILLAAGFCLENELGPVVLYSDSLLAIHVLQEESWGSDLREELREALDQARENVVLEFFHARREANRAAHELARLALFVSDVMI